MVGMTIHQRFLRRERDNPSAALRLRRGTRVDYAALSEHHYRAAKPATATRVLVYEDPRPSVVGRYLRRASEPGVVAVLVESLPSLSCRMRDWALHDRHGSHLEPAERALLINAELRCISRVVVDPRWRGLGLAVRLVGEALRTATTRYTEALAAMGKVHPFFEKAGMTAYPRPAHDVDLRLLDALRSVGLSAGDVSDLQAAWRHIESLPSPRRAWLQRELRGWYRKNAGRSGGYDRDPHVHLAKVRERLRLEPVYYLFAREENVTETENEAGASRDIE